MEKKHRTIVFAEDDKIIARLLKIHLLGEGYTAIHFENGEKVAQEVRKIKPDLILLDNMMPVKDGLTVLSELKNDPEVNKIPVIFLTSVGERDVVTQSLSQGAVDYILKSFEKGDLLFRIRRHLCE